MQSIIEAFRLGGYGMYLLALLAVFTYALSIGALIMSMRSNAKSAKLATISLGLDVLVTLIGAALYFQAMSMVTNAVTHAGAVDRPALLAQGRYEASMLIYGTAFTVALPFILSGIALLIGASRENRGRSVK
ncbi:MAG: hypothetical protein IPK60_17305 [Sandaracinaceae bacterium]|jgi:hypothetical protein|nr:hypothetical protein [Sandaracinaceae bacterium]